MSRYFQRLIARNTWFRPSGSHSDSIREPVSALAQGVDHSAGPLEQMVERPASRETRGSGDAPPKDAAPIGNRTESVSAQTSTGRRDGFVEEGVISSQVRRPVRQDAAPARANARSEESRSTTAQEGLMTRAPDYPNPHRKEQYSRSSSVTSQRSGDRENSHAEQRYRVAEVASRPSREGADTDVERLSIRDTRSTQLFRDRDHSSASTKGADARSHDRLERERPTASPTGRKQPSPRDMHHKSKGGDDRKLGAIREIRGPDRYPESRRPILRETVADQPPPGLGQTEGDQVEVRIGRIELKVQQPPPPSSPRRPPRRAPTTDGAALHRYYLKGW